MRMPATLDHRDLAVRAIAAACKLVTHGDRDREFVDQVVSAFGEAFNNVALHGYADRPIGDLQIEIDHGDDFLTIKMIDHGAGFDISTVDAPNLDDMPESGLGIFIIRSFMDEVDYHTGQPNTLIMTKRLNGVSAKRP